MIRQRQTIAVLALVGLFIALYLLLHALGIGGALKCGTGGCDTVQASRWAVFAGLPVAAYGVAGYVLILVVALAGSRPAVAGHPGWSVALLMLATVGFVFTIYLTYIEIFVIHAICRWCVGSAVVITLIFLVSLLGLRSPATHTDRAASPPLPDRPA